MGGLDLSAGLFEYFTDGDLGAPPLFGSWSYGSGSGGETTTTAASTRDRKSTRLNSSHSGESRMPSSA